MDDGTFADVKALLATRQRREKAAQLRAWREEMAQTPRSWTPTIKGGYIVHIELQPHWWLREGVTLIECQHIDSQVNLMDGKKGPVMDSHLPYPVFLAAAESFLKGMYLCRFPECRRIAFHGYIRPKRREHHLGKLKTFGHNLPKLIRALRRVKAYRTDTECSQFLAILEGVTRRYYYPLRDADENHGWATARYPKRFYNEETKDGRAEGLRTFPQHENVAALFKEMERYLDKKWSLRDRLRRML